MLNIFRQNESDDTTAEGTDAVIDDERPADITEQRIMICYGLIRDITDDEFDDLINGIMALRESYKFFQNSASIEQVPELEPEQEEEIEAAETALEELKGVA